MKWRYNRALVDINANVAAVARNVTEDPTHRDEGSPFIPHRLVFTHKYNIFDCSISSHIMTPPDLYAVAENAKATVNAYRQVWSDLDVVFLTDDDCREAISASEPQLLRYFENLKGMYKADLCRSAFLFTHGGYYFDVGRQLKLIQGFYFSLDWYSSFLT